MKYILRQVFYKGFYVYFIFFIFVDLIKVKQPDMN
jgi:hypothetical protein